MSRISWARMRKAAYAGLLATLISAGLIVAAAPAQAQPSWCRPWAFVGVPGSGQGVQNDPSDPWGRDIGSIRANFLMQRGAANVMNFPINYPATFSHNPLAALDSYNLSKDKGVLETRRVMEYVSAVCPRAYFVLAGYSQGAHVVTEVINSVGFLPRAKVYRVALIGNPRYGRWQSSSVPVDGERQDVGPGLFQPTLDGNAFDAYAEPKAKDVCIDGDWSCDPLDLHKPWNYDSPHNKYAGHHFPGAGSITITQWLGKYWLGNA
jgi:hypothetical protein